MLWMVELIKYLLFQEHLVILDLKIINNLLMINKLLHVNLKLMSMENHQEISLFLLHVMEYGRILIKVKY